MTNDVFFVCAHCNKKVPLKAPGTHNRNHCPFCLYSVHLDKRIGDRRAACGGKMQPIGKTYKKDGEEMVVQQCTQCGVTRKNRVAGDDSYTVLDALPSVEFNA